MAANFQQMNMAGAQQMMAQQQRMPQQRQQPGNGNQASMQVQQVIYNALSTQTGPLSGWQSHVLINERITLIFNVIGNLRLASQHQANAPPLTKMVEIGIKFEKDIFEKSQTKEQYKHEVSMKLDQLLERRNQQQANLQQSIQQQAQIQAQAQAQAHAQAQAQQQMMMNQNMQNQGMGMPQQPGQQGNFHLQHQMQASPLPGGQQQPPQMMQNGLPPNPTPNQQQQLQMALQQQQQNQVGAQGNGQGRPLNQPQLTAQDNSLVGELTQQLLNRSSEDEKNQLRQRLRTQMDPASFQKCQASGMDPIVLYYRQQAIVKLRQDKNARMQEAQRQALMQQGQNMSNAPPMQPTRSMQPSPAQQPNVTAGNPDFTSFMGNMEDVAAQQQLQGLQAEQAGQMVVPVSAAPRNGTPQPGLMPGQAMNVNDPRNPANPNQQAAQKQLMFNSQQLAAQRQQNAQQVQQAQSQVQARLNAQAKAQQIALNGQPGGLGPGPIAQQSPAMSTLNAPMRTPSQQMNHPETPQTNANPNQFNQPLNPRFNMPGNQRPGNPGLNPAMFGNMNTQGLPPDKLTEVINKWQNNPNGPRPGMPMQGNPQMRPGQQVPQPQMNAQQAAQFAAANPGQRLPPNMISQMTPQQQAMLQQQMARQQNMGPNVLQMEQRNLAQMDNMEFPPIFTQQPTFPQGYPPEIKRWGQLKQWAAQNPNLPPNVLETLKNLQRIHYTQLVTRSRAMQGAPGQQQQQQPGMPPNQAGPPNGMQPGGPGMAAPVAPMGPNAMPQGMNMSQFRQPTPQEIHQIRNHPSGKMAGASDDQIRQMFLSNQAKQQAALAQAMGPQHQAQEHQRRMVAMNTAMRQQNPQMQHPGQAPQMVGPQGQAKPPQPQAKPAQPTPNPAALSTTPNQAARQQPNARNLPQTSSPAPPVKNNLKRQNSDDVVEVPNPNTQSQQQPQPQQAQGGMQNTQRQPPKLTPQQLASMTPDMRKKYEEMVRISAVNQANRQMNPAENERINEKLKELSKVEEAESQRTLKDVPMDAETKAAMVAALRGIVGPLQNVSKVVGSWFKMTLDEEQAKSFFRARSRLIRQFQNPVTLQQPKETFSIYPQEVESARQVFGNMVKVLSSKYPERVKKETGSEAGTSQPQQQGSSNQPPTPLNAANLQQQQAALNKIHQRSNSRSSHTPAAPTSSQPPFQIGATSPHGAPAYANVKGLDVDKLHIPPRKKQKPSGPSQETPGSTSSPQVPKAASPQMKKHQQANAKPRPALLCKEPDCDRHVNGFDSEEELRKHVQEEHIGPLENPAKYVQDNLGSLLGLDAQGNSKKPITSTPEAPKMAASNSKQGQTPTMKTGNTPSAATPMMRQASMNRQASASGGKPNTPSKGAPSKDTKAQPAQKDAKPEAPAPLEFNDPWSDAVVDPNDLFQVFQPFETGAGGSISDLNVFRGITPNDTPESSKDGVSEPNSDISDGVGLDINLDLFDNNWMPFGPSDTDAMGDLNFEVANDEDLKMFDDMPSMGFQGQTFDDLDAGMFDKQFTLDTTFFSMDGS